MRWLNVIINSMDKSKKTLGDSEGQGSPAHCSPRGSQESDTTWRLNKDNAGGEGERRA